MRYELRKIGVYDNDTGKHLKPGAPGWLEYVKWLSQHNVPDPMPAVVPPAPQIDYAAAGRARRERVFKRMAKIDPIEAVLYREGMKK